MSVTFADSATKYSSTKMYDFAIGTTPAAAQTQITTDGTAIKNALAASTALQTYVGQVITI